MTEICKDDEYRPSSPSSYLIIANIGKENNAIQLIKVACAYKFIPLIVGLYKFINDETLQTYNCIRVNSLSEVKLMMNEKNIPIIGLEITEISLPVGNYTFPDFIAIMPGNEGLGLSKTQRQIVDQYIYIPQYGNGIESLNVTIATSVVIYQYCSQKLDFDCCESNML